MPERRQTEAERRQEIERELAIFERSREWAAIQLRIAWHDFIETVRAVFRRG
jgi:hypothetical protein